MAFMSQQSVYSYVPMSDAPVADSKFSLIRNKHTQGRHLQWSDFFTHTARAWKIADADIQKPHFCVVQRHALLFCFCAPITVPLSLKRLTRLDFLGFWAITLPLSPKSIYFSTFLDFWASSTLTLCPIRNFFCFFLISGLLVQYHSAQKVPQGSRNSLDLQQECACF